MTTTIEDCRRVLSAVGALHRRGYEGLRVMPVLDGERWTVFIGPRLAFSSRDGAYAVPDLRTRCLRFSPGQALPETDDFMELLGGLHSGVDFQAIFGESSQPDLEAGKRFRAWLEHSRLRDPQYRVWYLTLGGGLAFSVKGLPYRKDVEVPSSPDGPVFLAEFRPSGSGLDRCGIGEPLPRPPAGRAFSQEARKIDDPKIKTAQERPKDAPNLVWSSVGRSGNGRVLDEWYEDYVQRD